MTATRRPRTSPNALLTSAVERLRAAGKIVVWTQDANGYWLIAGETRVALPEKRASWEDYICGIIDGTKL